MAIFDFDVQRPFAVLDNLMKQWERVLVPIYLRSKQSNERVEGVGTGFILHYENRYFLVTALHVITRIGESGRDAYMNLNGHAAAMEKLLFRKSETGDVAVAELYSGWLQEKKIRSLVSVDVPIKKPGTALSMYFAIGFPANKNVLDRRYDKLKVEMFGMSMNQLAFPVETSISNAIFLEHDHEEGYNVDNELIRGHVHLQGMSGSPCFLVRQTSPQNEEEVLVHYVPQIIGVLVEWHKEQKTLVVAPIDIAIKLADWFLANLPN
jgi:hypothetical protein